MQKPASSILLIAVTTFIISSCTYQTHSQGMPPGQAKKVTGDKSAKAYAPGQQKKQ